MARAGDRAVTGVLRFFLDPGAGGCLWAGDAATRGRLGYGPVDAAVLDLAGRVAVPAALPLSEEACALRDRLMAHRLAEVEGGTALEPLHFDAEVDRLLALLRAETGHTILDEDRRPTRK